MPKKLSKLASIAYLLLTIEQSRVSSNDDFVVIFFGAGNVIFLGIQFRIGLHRKATNVLINSFFSRIYRSFLHGISTCRRNYIFLLLNVKSRFFVFAYWWDISLKNEWCNSFCCRRSHEPCSPDKETKWRVNKIKSNGSGLVNSSSLAASVV